MTFVRNDTPGTAFTYVGMKLNYVIGSGVEQEQTLLKWFNYVQCLCLWKHLYVDRINYKIIQTILNNILQNIVVNIIYLGIQQVYIKDHLVFLSYLLGIFFILFNF
ncbi:hypothetical protein [Spiroplasma mirum]|nr:hypothetical protein [Spiroplasma atrichopogonis]